MAEQATDREFKRLKDTKQAAGSSFAIGRGFSIARDWIARGLVRAGVTPNAMTILGFVMTCGAAACLFVAASKTHGDLAQAGKPPYMLIAGVFLYLASACDMLDGAVARIGGKSTAFGAFLDSALDRFSDLVIFVALIAHFAIQGNATYTVLASMGMANAFLISYIKARAESDIPDCAVGYWFRGERSAALLIACLAGHIPAVLWQQGILPFFTVIRRIVWTRQVVNARSQGRPAPENRPAPGIRGWLKPWRHPRGSVPYDIVTGANIAFIIAGPWIHGIFAAGQDPLRQWVMQ